MDYSEICQELLDLLTRNSSYEGGPGFREPETLERIRSIGEQLDEDGGKTLMLEVGKSVQSKNELAGSWLNNAWNGIGSWWS